MEKKSFLLHNEPCYDFVLIFGLLLLHSIGAESLSSLWLPTKLILVIILTGYHFFLLSCLRSFDIDENSHSPKFYRIINEVPTILLIIIVFIVIFKPL